MDVQILQLVAERGPISARRVAHVLGVSKRLVNGVLHSSTKTCKTERSPLSNVCTRPVWTLSDTPVRPSFRRKINSRNKNDRRKARSEYEVLVKAHAEMP